MQQQHAEVGRNGVEPAAMHDARARARGHVVATVDAFPDEQHFTGQVRVVGARAGARLDERKPLTAVGPHRGRHYPGRARKRRHRCRVRRISHQQRPGRRSSAEPRPDIGEPLRRPSREPDADAVWRMIGQIASHQPPDESGGAEHHHVQLTVSAHQLILKTRAPSDPGPERPPAADLPVRARRMRPRLEYQR